MGALEKGKELFRVDVVDNDQYSLNEIEVEEVDMMQIDCDNWHVLQGGNASTVEILQRNIADKKYRVKVDEYIFDIKINDELDLRIEEMGLNLIDEAIDSDVVAPMPGLVFEIVAKPGDIVAKGDALLILEAMKMENVIKAPGEGVVKSMHVKTGMPVEKGQLLVEMEVND